MAAPSKSADGKWLIGTLRLSTNGGPSATQTAAVPGMPDDTMVGAVAIDKIAMITDLVTLDADGLRVRDGVSIMLTTGAWIMLHGTRNQVATLLGIA